MRPIPQEKAHIWYHKSGKELIAREFMFPRGEPTIILLKEHSIKHPSMLVSFHINYHIFQVSLMRVVVTIETDN